MAKPKRYILFFLAALAFVILFSIGTSFLYANEGGDASLFKQMGLGVLRGKVLHRDLFDNKGPLLFLIHALGLALGGNTALLIMQAISLTATFIIWDKILALRCTERQRWIRMGILVLLLICFYYDGDLSEEWCLPWASWPVLVYLREEKGLSGSKGGKGLRSLKGLKGVEPSTTLNPLNSLNSLNLLNPFTPSNSLTPFNYFLTGLCLGVITFIRPNNAVPFIGFILYDFIIRLTQKDLKGFFKTIGLLAAGALVIALPIFAYFYIIAGWSGVDDMIYGAFLSNFEYMDLDFTPKWFKVTNYFTIVGVAIVLQILNTRKEKDVLIPILIAYALFLLTFGKRFYAHYLMAILPLFVVMFASFPPRQNKGQPQHLLRTISMVLALLATPASLHFMAKPMGIFIHDNFIGEDPFKKIYADFHECVKDIPEEERDSICIYNFSGLCSGMMQHEGLVRCNRRFIWKAQIVDRLIREAEAKGAFEPIWVVISYDNPYFFDDSLYLADQFDLKHHFSADVTYLEKPVRMGKQKDIWIYRRR